MKQRAEAVHREPGLGQGPRLCRRDPAAVPPRGRSARADPRAIDDRDVDVPPAQVVRAAEAGDAAADDDDSHEGMPAVTSTSTSIPGTVNSVTIVVRTGRGGGKYSAQRSFHAPKSSARRR